jgi:hypothetical protein
MVLVWKPKGRKSLGRPRRRWEDNIKLDFEELCCRGVDWIDLAQEGAGDGVLLNAVMNLRVT